MNAPIVEAVGQILRDKNIDRDIFQEIIESVFLSMIKKKYGSADNFDVIFNLEKGDIEIFCEKEVVDDDDLTDPVTQIPLSRALTIDEDLDIGDTYAELVPLNDFGRRLVTSARQNLTQKIKEIEKENIFTEFSARIGEVISGEIHQINRREIRVHIDRHDALLPKSEQIYNEKYTRGKTIRAIIKEVNRTTKEPDIILSRSDPSFVRRLFELEVPEIFDNIIEIKDIAREPGDRTKIAVVSHDKRIDPVGACVGMKGVRIQAIVRELNNEKIDIIHWSPDPEMFIRRAMAPVTPLLVMVDEETLTATVIVPDDQIQFAIGRRGQNVRLASQLTGHHIEPIKESEYLAPEELLIEEIAELEDEIKTRLREAGYETADTVLDAGNEKLMEIEGLDEPTVKRILEVVQSYYVEENESETEAEPVPAADTESAALPDQPAKDELPAPDSGAPESEEERG
ncbi:transcription termination factor NusA [bacterium]|nr:transcription termination factor NusA [bacterium]MBU1984972.1 transcription termination factor NusA [bacterium]